MRRFFTAMVFGLAAGSAGAQGAAPATYRVTADNFPRAETDTYFARFVARGGLGRFQHARDLTDIDQQSVVRSNRDTLYSSAVFDLEAGPATITLPDAGKRFVSMQVIDEDHFCGDTRYTAGPHTLTREQVGTRYAFVLLRLFVNPADAADVAAVHALQDAVTVQQAATGTFETPRWDPVSLGRVRDALRALGGVGTTRMFGAREKVDPVHHLIGTATGWGGNPAADAVYQSGSPALNDGDTVHRVTVRDVPVDAFWSVSVYNREGFFAKNVQRAYSLNNVTAEPDADGAFTLQFGGCAAGVRNCLPVTPGWGYTVRLYRPRPEAVDGRWVFPEPRPEPRPAAPGG
jgi:hypothetical protein